MNEQWNTSSLSRSAQKGECVEVRQLAEGVQVRHSKNPDGDHLLFTTAEWDAFVGGVKIGEFDT